MYVAQLWRFPVKSFRGERIETAEFVSGGIPFDRSHMVLDPDPHRVGKPLTGRIDKRILGYGASVGSGVVRVLTPSGVECDWGDRAWREELGRELGAPVDVQTSNEPVHDDSEVLIVNAASVRLLSEEYGAPIDPQRFRPNIIVDGTDALPFEETEWGDATFAAGTAVMQVVHPCARCVMTTIDPVTLAVDPAFLRFVVEKYGANFGTYCRVVRPGTIRVGDTWTAVSGMEASA